MQGAAHVAVCTLGVKSARLGEGVWIEGDDRMQGRTLPVLRGDGLLVQQHLRLGRRRRLGVQRARRSGEAEQDEQCGGAHVARSAEPIHLAST